MRTLVHETWLILALAVGLASCHQYPKQEAPAASGKAGEQSVSSRIAQLYMAAGAAPRHSREQQKLVQQMGEEASNGKELLMVMRAATGVFEAGQNTEDQLAEHRLCSTVAAKMMKVGTLEQLADFALHYPVNAEDARPLVERMNQLAEGSSDSHVWYQIVRVARSLKIHDLAKQAQTKGDLLAAR